MIGRIPDFDANGNLPPGVYAVTLKDIGVRYAWNTQRRKLYQGLRKALMNLSSAGVRRVWINGSFITKKDLPNDIDGCWEASDSLDTDLLDPVFLETHPPRVAMKDKFGVDFLISGTALRDRRARGRTVEGFFQIDRNGNAKGILLVDLEQSDDTK